MNQDQDKDKSGVNAQGVFAYHFTHNGKRYIYHGTDASQNSVNSDKKNPLSSTITYQGAVQKRLKDMTNITEGYSDVDMNFTVQARLMERKDVHFQGQQRPYVFNEDKPPKISVLPTFQLNDIKPDKDNKSFLGEFLNANKNAKQDEKAERIIVPVGITSPGKAFHMTGIVSSHLKKKEIK